MYGVCIGCVGTASGSESSPEKIWAALVKASFMLRANDAFSVHIAHSLSGRDQYFPRDLGAEDAFEGDVRDESMLVLSRCNRRWTLRGLMSGRKNKRNSYRKY